jgi:hypothetical protein
MRTILHLCTYTTYYSYSCKLHDQAYNGLFLLYFNIIIIPTYTYFILVEMPKLPLHLEVYTEHSEQVPTYYREVHLHKVNGRAPAKFSHLTGWYYGTYLISIRFLIGWI